MGVRSFGWGRRGSDFLGWLCGFIYRVGHYKRGRFCDLLLIYLIFLQFSHSAGHRHNCDDMTLSSRAGSTRLRPFDDTNDFVRLDLCSPFLGGRIKTL